LGSSGTQLLVDAPLDALVAMICAHKARLRELIIISPWLSVDNEDRRDSLLVIADELQDKRVEITIVTRPPELKYHVDAIATLRRRIGLRLFTCPTLHTKLYLLQCDGLRCAVVGSPNLTRAATHDNRELAIVFRTTMQTNEDDIAALITQLQEYALELLREDDVLEVA